MSTRTGKSLHDANRGRGRLALALGLLLAAVVSLVGRASSEVQGTLPVPAPEPALRDVRVDTVALDEFDADGLQVAVRVTAIATTTATLDHLVFDRATVDDLPLNLPPVAGPIQLEKGEPVLGLPP